MGEPGSRFWDGVVRVLNDHLEIRPSQTKSTVWLYPFYYDEATRGPIKKSESQSLPRTIDEAAAGQLGDQRYNNISVYSFGIITTTKVIEPESSPSLFAEGK